MVKHSQRCDERFFYVAIHDLSRSLSCLDEAGFRLSSFNWFVGLCVLQGFKWLAGVERIELVVGCFIGCVRYL
jgi:hypothetical protein